MGQRAAGYQMDRRGVEEGSSRRSEGGRQRGAGRQASHNFGGRQVTEDRRRVDPDLVARGAGAALQPHLEPQEARQQAVERGIGGRDRRRARQLNGNVGEIQWQPGWMDVGGAQFQHPRPFLGTDQMAAAHLAQRQGAIAQQSLGTNRNRHDLLSTHRFDRITPDLGYRPYCRLIHRSALLSILNARSLVRPLVSSSSSPRSGKVSAEVFQSYRQIRGRNYG